MPVYPRFSHPRPTDTVISRLLQLLASVLRLPLVAGTQDLGNCLPKTCGEAAAVGTLFSASRMEFEKRMQENCATCGARGRTSCCDWHLFRTGQSYNLHAKPAYPRFSHPRSTDIMIPLLLLFLASFLRLPPLVSAQDLATCSPKTCGDLTVAYPFWLEEEGQQPCGSPSFQLNCNGSQALLSRSMFGAYQVLQIFAENSSFVAVDNNLPLDDGCPPWWFNISLGLGLSPFVISNKNRELLVLDNCTKEATPPGFSRTGCADESFYRLGGVYGDHQREQSRLPPSCRVAVVPVLGFADGSTYVPIMRKGFLLEWTVASGDCSKCVASGGRCSYGNDGTGFSCHCSDGVRRIECGEFGDSTLHPS
nr:LEAF RUST 10 DISEASE-RESISTANCE LOCUS RECEPTOR-LIKE PROTEIN KINASE-like 1.2 [Aegilops tauschii subsp. strangulata]